ncbi:MAG: sugar kinase [Pseudoflavonifractor sp.]
MAYEIVSIGALLCEVMRKELDRPLDRAADFTGPYPSGDSGIMLNAAAKLGAKSAMIGVVGDDGFGRCIVERLQESGADCSMVRVHPTASTGVAFVCYFRDGSRNFLYHVHHAAPGMMSEEDVHPDRLKGTQWLHVSGFALSVSPGAAAAIHSLVAQLPPETQVCFDPNIRPEALSVEEIKRLCAPVLERASIVFPSKSEAMMFTGAATDDEGCRIWAAQGKTVVLKNGAAGSRIFSGDRVFDVPSYAVAEVDPTGAGDTFCGAFLTGLISGMSLEACGRFANAAGALSVCRQGPMEGAPTRAEVEAFMAANG